MDTTPQTEPTALGRLAGRCYDRRRLVLVLWIVAIIGITVLSQVVGTSFKNKFTSGNTLLQQAQNILQQRFPSKSKRDTADIVFRTATPIPENQAAINKVLDSVQPLPYVQGVTSPFSPEGAHQIAPKGNIAYAEIQFTTDTADIPTGAVKKVISTAQSTATHGFQVELGGSPISAAATAAPGPSEGIGITAALLIMLLAFGSVVAMGLPVITALRRSGHRRRPARADHPRADRAELLARDGGDDRHRRGHRLRPLHRHALSTGHLRGSDAATPVMTAHMARPRLARSSSPGPPWSSRSSAST